MTPETLLAEARDSLEDAKGLARRGRRTATLLRDLALRQALSAIGLRDGLDRPDALDLETLLRHVPAVHPQAGLVRSLADPQARSAASIAALIDALSRPQAVTPVQEHDEPRDKQWDKQPGKDRSADGPTAFESAPPGNPRRQTAPSASSAAFWTLMDRWRITDLDALAMIGHRGGLTKRGTRPRFRLLGREAERYAMLRRIDAALGMLALAPDWLHDPQPPSPFKGRTPCALLVADPDHGGSDTLQVLNRQGLRAAIT